MGNRAQSAPLHVKIWQGQAGSSIVKDLVHLYDQLSQILRGKSGDILTDQIFVSDPTGHGTTTSYRDGNIVFDNLRD